MFPAASAWTTPPKLASSPATVMIQPPSVTLTSQTVLVGTVHVLFASPNGSPASWVVLLLVSAKAWMTLSPGSSAVKQKVASPAPFVVRLPVAGDENVACAPITLKR